jgi:hypothetical protein
MNDLKKMTFAQLAEVVVSVWAEVKRRNPIFVNSYETPFAVVVMNLRQIGKAEKDNPTCEAGPKVKVRRQYKLHWAKLNGDAYCGGSLTMETTREKQKVSCLKCRKQMKLHGHLEDV